MIEFKEQFAVMKMFEIKDVVQHYETNKTFYLNEFVECIPGQFMMVWIPGVDEKPFSLMNIRKKSALNLEVKGKWSQKFFKMKTGEKIGLRGPFGTGFSWKKVKKACIIAGGVGVVPLLQLTEKLKLTGVKTTFLLGAQTKKKLLFEKQIRENAAELIITTDDGSSGSKGFVTAALEELLKKKKFDCCYTCGPELMMHKVFELCEKFNVNLQASLERFMKCGVGICGSCMVDDIILCVEGPVLGLKTLRSLKEFGKTAYLKSGKKSALKEFYAWRSP